MFIGALLTRLACGQGGEDGGAEAAQDERQPVPPAVPQQGVGRELDLRVAQAEGDGVGGGGDDPQGADRVLALVAGRDVPSRDEVGVDGVHQWSTLIGRR